MEIKGQDIFANVSNNEEVQPTEPSPVVDTDSQTAPVAASVPVDDSTSVAEAPSTMPKDEPFELKAEEPVMRKKPASKSTAKPASTQVVSPVSVADSTSVVDNTPAAESPKSSNIIWQLFKTFFKIGIVTFGGGYAMIPMIESEVVDKKKWVEKEQFLDLIAIAQTCPGVFAINISTFIGYKLRHNFGACMAALGAALPSFLIILLIATMFTQIQDIPWVAACFRGIRPAVVALIAVPTFNLAKSAKINLSTCWIPIISALLIWALHVNPVFIIIAAALGGYLYGTLIKEK